MAAMNPIPHRGVIRAVLMARVGLGWHVGVELISAGTIEGKYEAFIEERKAQATALPLAADACDLIRQRALQRVMTVAAVASVAPSTKNGEFLRVSANCRDSRATEAATLYALAHDPSCKASRPCQSLSRVTGA